MNAHPGALRFVSSTLSRLIRPAPPLPFPDWLQKNIVLVDGPRKDELWSPVDAPYLVEIAACLSQEHPSTLVTVRKSQQTGVSILALAWMLYIAELCPDNALYGVPGISALQDVNSGKLQPLIDAWQTKTEKSVIYPATSRSGSGSTTYEKKFAGGSLYLANANTVMDLSAKTIRYGVKDEVSKWQVLPNGADPENLFFGRFTAFRRQKSFKIFELSTPELDSGSALQDDPSHCRIDRSFRKSDQRFWNIRCPECNFEQVQFFGNLRINEKRPHETRYLCENCGHEISEMERVFAVRSGRFIATQSGPDRHPGFHVDAFVSLMMSYEAIAEDYIKYREKGEPGMKDFNNVVLGLPYAMKGDAPDHVRLMERRDHSLIRGHIPASGLVFVGSADVQMNGIWYLFKAYGPDRQSWRVDAGYIEGPTDDPHGGAFVKLEELRQKQWPDAYGRARRVDLFGIDSGYRSHVVYTWCRGKAGVMALKGEDGWSRPPIGQPKPVDINFNGQRIRNGCNVWAVGTWSLKGVFYSNLRKEGRASGREFDPPGFCHFGGWLDEVYFKQITSEYLGQTKIKHRMVQAWMPRQGEENHLLDCEVYGDALADYLGVNRMTVDEWQQLAMMRGVPDDIVNPELFAPAPILAASQAGDQPPAAADTEAETHDDGESWHRSVSFWDR
ncbi:terminase gpA endonuclease subunit [Rhizobium sp. RU36D]|uniref:terminase gpA endonuclease subunit n=1 Tax=Rhizobium sp. RU36D TaxID=1907415 RepID=UPI0009D85CC9|nr:terminase gpA endonuclease subunit [Rhizobium sp. RU36D]SMD18522.1 Phage terminase, large subunit GpA [Rhizobium sp. RU36D]